MPRPTYMPRPAYAEALELRNEGVLDRMLRSGVVVAQGTSKSALYLYWEPMYYNNNITTAYVVEHGFYRKVFDTFEEAFVNFQLTLEEDAVELAIKALGVKKGPR